MTDSQRDAAISYPTGVKTQDFNRYPRRICVHTKTVHCWPASPFIDSLIYLAGFLKT